MLYESKNVDADMLESINEKILRMWGISLPILTSNHTKEQYDVFFKKFIEPLQKGDNVAENFTAERSKKHEKIYSLLIVRRSRLR